MYTGRYGLGSKDTTPGQIVAVYRNMEAGRPKKRFTIGIEDDVTKLSLKVKENLDTTPKGTRSCKFWGLGSDGTVGANKNSIKIIGDHTDMYAQGYFAYDSKKSGGVTISHLRFGKKPIKSTYFVSKADFVACHNPSYVDKYDMVSDVKPGGIFLLNCSWDAPRSWRRSLPAAHEAVSSPRTTSSSTPSTPPTSAKGLGLGNRTNTILQAAFFKLAKVIPTEDAVQFMKDAATKSYSKKGEAIVKMNHDAIECGVKEVKKVRGSQGVGQGGGRRREGSRDHRPPGDQRLYRQHPDTRSTRSRAISCPSPLLCKDADGTVPLGSAAL